MAATEGNSTGTEDARSAHSELTRRAPWASQNETNTCSGREQPADKAGPQEAKEDTLPPSPVPGFLYTLIDCAIANIFLGVMGFAFSYGLFFVQSFALLFGIAVLVYNNELSFILSDLIPNEFTSFTCLSVLICEVALYAYSTLQRKKTIWTIIARFMIVAIPLLSGSAVLVIKFLTHETGISINVLNEAAIFAALAACCARTKNSFELASAGLLLVTLLLWILLQVKCAHSDMLRIFVVWGTHMFMLSMICAVIFFVCAMLTSARFMPIGQFFVGVCLVITAIMSNAAPVLPYALVEGYGTTAPSVNEELGGLTITLWRGIQQQKLRLGKTFIIFYVAMSVIVCSQPRAKYEVTDSFDPSAEHVSEKAGVFEILAECVHKAKNEEQLSHLMTEVSQRCKEMSRSTVDLSLRRPSEAGRLWAIFMQNLLQEMTEIE